VRSELRLIGLRLAWTLILGLFGALPTAAEFYQGKQLVILVNFAPGGPTDAEGRLLARHIARHVAGIPSVIVQNMDGSNGAVAANWIANAAAPDGLILGYFTGIASMRALADPVLSPNVAKLGFVAAGPGFGIAYARTDIGGGLKKPSDIVQRKDFWVGGLRPDSDRDIRIRMQLDLLGARYQYQSGFASIADARQAFQRGEIQVLLEPITAYRAAIEPWLGRSGMAMPLWFDPLDDGDGFQRSVEADNLPALTFSDILLQLRGSLPKGELFDAWRLVNQMGTLFQRILVMAPDTPPAAIAAVRKGLAKLVEDAQFKEDALRSIRLVPSYVGDERTEAQFKRIADPPPALQAFLKKYIEQVAPEPAREPPARAAEPPRK
jgi:hypothetical protein